MKNLNKKDNSDKPFAENSEAGRLAKYAKAAYFLEKDKKASEFLKKHPIPSKFLKQEG
jgi:hypothetical protein